MAKLPKEVCEAWDNRAGAVVLTTVSKAGVANSIYATCVSRYDDETIVVADNYFDKTRQNILNGSRRGVLLFITGDNRAYQIKGTLEYHTDGPLYAAMKSWNDPRHPGHAAVALRADEVYKGAEKLV